MLAVNTGVELRVGLVAFALTAGAAAGLGVALGAVGVGRGVVRGVVRVVVRVDEGFEALVDLGGVRVVPSALAAGVAAGLGGALGVGRGVVVHSAV